MNYQSNKNIPGYVYLMKAEKFGGLIPGCLIGRYKIGLSIDPDARLDQLLSSQPCTDITLIHTVDVSDMAEVEGELHDIFKNSNVKLIKSREWFSFNLIQVQRCIWLMKRYEIKSRGREPISFRAVIGGLIALLGVGMLVGHSFQPQAINQTRIEKSVKSR